MKRESEHIKNLQATSGERQVLDAITPFLTGLEKPIDELAEKDVDAFFAQYAAAHAESLDAAFITCRINDIVVNPTTVMIVGEAILPSFCEDSLKINARINGNVVKCTQGEPREGMLFEGKSLLKYRPFRISTTNNVQKKDIRISFIVDYRGFVEHKKYVELGKYLPLGSKADSAAVLGNRLVRVKDGELSLKIANQKEEREAEKRNVKTLRKGGPCEKQAASLRQTYRRFKKLLPDKTVVLCSDDSASTSFRGAAVANALAENPGISVYYVSESVKTPPLSKKVKRLSRASRNFAKKYILCDLQLSSDENFGAETPLGAATDLLKDLIYTKPFIYLPDERLPKNEEANFRYGKNIAYRVVRSVEERETFLDGSHGYTLENLWLIPEETGEEEYLAAIVKKLRYISRQW